MSYLCDGVDDRLVGALAAAKAGAPLTISAWGKGVSNTGNARVLASVAATDGVLDNSEYLNITTAGFLQANTRTTSNANAQTLVAIPDSTWFHGCAVYAASNDRRIYLNGTNKITNTTSRGIAAVLDTIVLGSRSDASGFFPGRVAEFAVWDVILSDADAAALAAGASPMSLTTPPLRYYRLKTDALDINGANGLAVTGATLDADHPTVDNPPGGTTHVTTTWASSYTVNDHVTTTWQSSYAVKDHVIATWQSSYGVKDHVTTTWSSSYGVKDHVTITWQSSYVVKDHVQTSWSSNYIVKDHVTTTWSSSYDVVTTGLSHVEQSWSSSWITRDHRTVLWSSVYGVADHKVVTWASSWTTHEHRQVLWASRYTVHSKITNTWQSSYAVLDHVLITWTSSFLVGEKLVKLTLTASLERNFILSAELKYGIDLAAVLEHDVDMEADIG